MVSVIVPVYNVEAFLPACVESILNQTDTDIEIILVDDGSTDGSGKICDAYQKKDTRIQVLHQKNQGLSAARNNGMKYAHGAYYSFIDSDDCIAPTMIAMLLDLCEKHNAQMAACGHQGLGENEKPDYTNTNNPRADIHVFSREDALYEMFVTTSVDVVAWNKLYAANLFCHISYPVGMLFEDMRTTYKLIGETNKVVFIDRPLYYYRARPTSIGHMPFSDKWYALSDAIDEAYQAVCVWIGKSTKLTVQYAQWKMAVVNKMLTADNPKWEAVREAQGIVRSCIKGAMQSKRLPSIRKAEQLLFAINSHLYRAAYLHYSRGKK